jgi:uncharacterized protein
VAGVAGGMMTGVAFGVVQGVAGGVMTGVAFGVAVGVAGGMMTGVAGGVAFIFGFLRLYFWLPELLGLLLLRVLPLPAEQRLRYLPPHFDELIRMPLPFMASWIAEAHRSNPTAARQTLDYFINSTNQQACAARAMTAIAVDTFHNCQSAQDLAALGENLHWMSQAASPWVRTCLDLGQDVRSALESTSIFRQAQNLDIVGKKLHAHQGNLATASSSEATRFGGVFKRWQDIIANTCHSLREKAEQSKEIPQVYVSGPALEEGKAGALFKGRRDLFRQLEALILSRQAPHLALYGGRRTGKTSTLNYLPKFLPSHILSLLVDNQALASATTLSGWAELFAHEIIASAKKNYQLHLPEPDAAALQRDPFVALNPWLDKIEKMSGEKILLLCLDEFERMEELIEATRSRTPLNFLRNLMQHRSRWIVLLSGAKMPQDLAPYWSDYLINTQTLRISFLNHEESLDLIRTPVKEFPPDIWPVEAAEEIWRLTAGHPYFIQLLCSTMVDFLNQHKKTQASKEEVEIILPQAFGMGYQVFREFWNSCTAAEQEVLRTRAEEGILNPEQKAAVPALIQRDVLSPDLSFRVPLLKKWLLCKDLGESLTVLTK